MPVSAAARQENTSQCGTYWPTFPLISCWVFTRNQPHVTGQLLVLGEASDRHAQTVFPEVLDTMRAAVVLDGIRERLQMDTFVYSVALVLATGLVSLFVAWQQNRFAERRARQEREDAILDRRASIGRDHALALHNALNDLVQVGIDAKSHGETRVPDRSVFKGPMTVARREYLLIPDVPMREAIADGLTVLVGRSSSGITLDDWHEAAASTSFVVAAYLRGEEPPTAYAEQLKDLRAKYPRG